MNILIIEDDPGIGRVLEQYLRPRHKVQLVTSGRAGFYYAQSGTFDLLLLDLGLPDISGAEVCRRLRSQGFAKPILILTGESRVTTKIELLDSGADDYLTKPFSIEELASRIGALLRRVDPKQSRTILRINDLALDISARQVWRDGRLIILRRKEFELLEYLMQHPGIALSRSRLLYNVWGIDENPWPNTVDAQIKNLREKVDRPFERKIIKTIYGLGYRLETATDAIA